MAYMAFDEMIKNLAQFIRDDLKQVEEISRLDFTIVIDGRVHDGDLRIKLEIGGYGEGGVVKGGRLLPVLEEYKRRFGWDQRNAPLCIGFDGAKSDDDLPF